MDVLVSLGTNAAYIYSLLSIFGQRLHVRPALGRAGRQLHAELPVQPSGSHVHLCRQAATRLLRWPAILKPNCA